jgi:Lactonase, 7-bladed beta-propeller
VRRSPTSVSPLRHQSTRHFMRLVFCSGLLSFATAAFAAPTVTVLSPKAASDSGSPVFYEAYATSPSCASGISAMRIYSAPGVNAYTVNGAHIETFIPLKAGTYSTVVQAWDNCGGVGKKTVDITINSDAGVSVFLPKSSSADIPVHIAASAQNPDCSAGISAIRIYTGNGIAPYTVESDEVNTFVNLLPGTYDLTVQAWDNCGHVYKAPLTETAVGAGDGYLYATTSNKLGTNTSDEIAEFTINDGVLTNPNGSGNPPSFAAASGVNAIAVDPGGWFVYAITPSGIYGYQIDQSNGNLTYMPGSPFPANDNEPTGIAVDPNGNFLFVAYNLSNTVVAYQINRSSGALTETESVTGSGGMTLVTADFTGQYVYADNDNDNEVTVWGWAVNPNNGHLTAVPGSPYNVPAGNYNGGTLSSTMLPSGSPASPVLYVQIGGPSNPQMGYTVDFGTGALTDTPGYDPYGCDECGPILADNQGKWIWGASAAPVSPPQNWFEILSIASNGSGYGTTETSSTGDVYISALAEDGTGLYLYTSGENCPNGNCGAPEGTVMSWKLSDGVPTALTGPLNTGSNATAYGMGVARKSGD